MTVIFCKISQNDIFYKKIVALQSSNDIMFVMETIVNTPIPKYKFREPRRNLSNNSSRKNTERNFTLKFARAYISQIDSIHHKTIRTEVDFAREIPMNGFGIADFVVVFWNTKKFKAKKSNSKVIDFPKNNNPIIRAFELKISNWRKALIQAHRYRYFADATIVVLPSEKIKVASKYLNTFRAINVGLWSFSESTNKIATLYTPRPTNSFEPRYKPRVIQLVSKAQRFA